MSLPCLSSANSYYSLVSNGCPQSKLATPTQRSGVSTTARPGRGRARLDERTGDGAGEEVEPGVERWSIGWCGWRRRDGSVALWTHRRRRGRQRARAGGRGAGRIVVRACRSLSECWNVKKKGEARATRGGSRATGIRGPSAGPLGSIASSLHTRTM